MVSILMDNIATEDESDLTVEKNYYVMDDDTCGINDSIYAVKRSSLYTH